MFNVTILKMKDIIKYCVGIIATIVIIVLISKTLKKDTKHEEKLVRNVGIGIKTMSENILINCLDQTIPTIAQVNQEYKKITEEDNEQNNDKNTFLKEVLKSQIGSIKEVENTKKNIVDDTIISENQEEQSNNEEQVDDNSQTVLVKTGIQTEVITQNPISENYNTQYGSVKIKNQTSYELTEQMLIPDITIENKNILIFHTHSCESYTTSDAFPYTPTGNFRTTDLNFTVTRVGSELENQLKQYNFNVIHDKSYHDYPSYNGSYTRSLETVQNILKTTSSDIIIDLHRDAVGSRSDYAPKVKIGETDIAAQIMFVIGTNEGGLWHPNWNQNLKFAIKVQEKANELYPGLCKPIMLTNYRYNQHTGKYANIIEVGATGNTLEECICSMKYLAKVMSEL